MRLLCQHAKKLKPNGIALKESAPLLFVYKLRYQFYQLVYLFIR